MCFHRLVSEVSRVIVSGGIHRILEVQEVSGYV